MTEMVAVDKLAARINLEHNQVIEGLRASLSHAINAGDLLAEAKVLVGHGEWLNWIKDNCAFSERTAQNYMRLAENKDELSNTQRVADLSYRGALLLLAENKTDYEIREYGNLSPLKDWQKAHGEAMAAVEQELEELNKRLDKAEGFSECLKIAREAGALSNAVTIYSLKLDRAAGRCLELLRKN